MATRSDLYNDLFPTEAPVGYIYITDRVNIAVYKPINRFHRLMLKWFFGWTYEPCRKE